MRSPLTRSETLSRSRRETWGMKAVNRTGRVRLLVRRPSSKLGETLSITFALSDHSLRFRSAQSGLGLMMCLDRVLEIDLPLIYFGKIKIHNISEKNDFYIYLKSC